MPEAKPAPGAFFVLCLLPFIVLATLNAGGYRYGASDQAFYLPAVLAKLDPALYPRDTPVIAAQAKLTTYDEIIAMLARATGARVEVVCVVLYVASLVLIACGTWLVARSMFLTKWAAVALLAAMTLRHAIARSGTNTLEGYFHPRQIAFGLGLIAVGAFLRGRFALVALLIVAAGAVHPTAALWFAVWLAAAVFIVKPSWRRSMGSAAVVLAAVAVWALTAGPLAGRLRPMDDEWLRMLGAKDYLFPLQWPAYAWTLNLGYLAIVVLIYRHRRRVGLVNDLERAMVVGSSVLAAVFGVALVAHALRITLAFQLQPARLFLLFDFLATVYVVWGLAEGRSPRANRAAAVMIVLVALTAGRAIHVIISGRPIVQLRVPDNDWGRVMAWAKQTEKSSGWLADPLHAAVYGTSVRLAGERDVFVEAIKDAALGIYDREVARRTDERFRTVKEFHLLTAEKVVTLAAQYDLDYFVSEHPVDLPVAFESGKLRVYRLR